MARSWYTRSNVKPNFIQTPRVKAVARERAWMAAHPYSFEGHDYVAAHLRKRARDRMHTITRELQYLKRAPRVSNYMPRRLLRNPKYKKYPRVRLPQQVYRKKF